ncbi:MAG: hypothetical protein KC584_18690, partial [Nitrospira sp.]|nr:hypothetical protein [Nitrospira sp.]
AGIQKYLFLFFEGKPRQQLELLGVFAHEIFTPGNKAGFLKSRTLTRCSSFKNQESTPRVDASKCRYGDRNRKS